MPPYASQHKIFIEMNIYDEELLIKFPLKCSFPIVSTKLLPNFPYIPSVKDQRAITL